MDCRTNIKSKRKIFSRCLSIKKNDWNIYWLNDNYFGRKGRKDQTLFTKNACLYERKRKFKEAIRIFKRFMVKKQINLCNPQFSNAAHSTTINGFEIIYENLNVTIVYKLLPGTSLNY